MKIQMRHILFLSFCAAFNFIIININAQDTTAHIVSKYYVRASLGFGEGINGQYFQNTDDNYKVTNTLSNYGNGIYSLVAAGYQVNNNLALELGFGSLNGFQNNLYPPSKNDFEKSTGQMWQVVPSVVFSTSSGVLRPYLRTGLIIGLPVLLLDAEGYDNTVMEEKLKVYGGFAAGIQSALGFTVPLHNNKINLFAEASFYSISFIPQRASLYYDTQNGVDMFSTLQVSQKETVFKQTGTNYIYPPNPSNTPMQDPLNLFAFGGLSLNIGIKINLGNQQSTQVATGASAKHLYARINGGYGFATDGDIFYDMNDTFGATAVMFSGGKGFNAGIGVGYMINSNIGLDLGFNYDFGNTLKSTQTGVIAGLYIPGIGNAFGSPSVSSISGTMAQLNPAIVFTTNIQKFKPYARFGLLLGSATVYTTSDNKGDSIFQDNTHSKIQYYGGISIGFNATLGIAYPISDRFDVFTEACFNTIYDVPTKGEIIEATNNGVNFIDKLSGSKNIEFESSYDASKVNIDLSQPSVESQIKFSFNAMVASVGIRFWIR